MAFLSLNVWMSEYTGLIDSTLSEDRFKLALLVPALPTGPHPSTPFATSNNLSFSFHSCWVISLSVDTRNQGNPAWLIVADIRWQNLYTPVGTQRQGEKQGASDYKAVTANQQGISKWEITFSLTKSFLATEKQSGVSSSSINTVCISFTKTNFQFWQPGIKKVLPLDLTVHYKHHDPT